MGWAFDGCHKTIPVPWNGRPSSCQWHYILDSACPGVQRLLRRGDVVANLQILEGDKEFRTAWKMLPRPQRRIVLAAVRGGRAVADPKLAAFAVGYVVQAKRSAWIRAGSAAFFGGKAIEGIIRSPAGTVDWWIAAGGGLLLALAILFLWRVIHPRHARAERLNREIDSANRTGWNPI